MKAILTLLVALPLAAQTTSGSLALSQDGLTVYDTANGVTWLADFNSPASNRFGLPLCNGSGNGTQTCLNASGSMNYQTAAAWVAAMNAANYLGRSDWQIPVSLFTDKACPKVGPNGGSFGFGCAASAYASLYLALGLKSPNTSVPIPGNTVGPFSNFQPYLYWSQSSAGPTQGNATFSFATGFQGANTLPNFLYLLPMIPGKLAGTPSASGQGLQTNPGGQTVYDPETNITWAANANLAATNAFGLPACTDPATPALCVNKDGAMTWTSAMQFIANMNTAAYLGQTNWQAPAVDSTCPNFNCDGARNPMGNLFYDQLGLIPGTPVVAPPNTATGPFRNTQPYLYWTCQGATVQSACLTDGPAPNFEWSYSFGSGFQGTDLLANNLYVTAYFVGSRTSSSGPVIAEVANAEGESPIIAPNTWLEIKGAGLAPAGDSRTWQSSDFTGGQMPSQLDHVSVTVNGKSAFVYYISPSQINILTPPDALNGSVQVVVTNNGVSSSGFSVRSQSMSPSFFLIGGGPYIAATHADGSLLSPTVPAKPGETIVLYANGFGATNTPITTGSISQSGTLSPVPVVKIGATAAVVQFAGLVFPGQFQFNVVVPPGAADGDQPVSAAYNGLTTTAGSFITVQQ